MFEGECATDALPSPPRTKKTYSMKDNTKKTRVSDSDSSDDKGEQFKDTQPPQNQNVLVHISHSSGIQFGHTFIVGDSKKKPQAPLIKETKMIRSLKNNTNPVTPKDINLISLHLCEGWQRMARELGYSNGEIYKFQHKHHNDVKQCIYDLLTDWIQNSPYVATVGKLAQTMWNTDQQEAVELWAEQYDKIHQ